MKCRVCQQEMRPETIVGDHCREKSPFGDICWGCWFAVAELEKFLIRACDRTVMGAWAEGVLRAVIANPTRFRGLEIDAINSTIQAFTALYAGGLAQSLRDKGDASAMPPWAETYWLGKQVVKCPMDLWVYQEIIYETRPELIIETGTSGGGSAWFFATLFDLIGKGHVITVDKDAYLVWREHPRITQLLGDSADERVAEMIRRDAAGKRTMVSLDSLHTYEHVKAELELYGELVTPDCYLVVEDTAMGNPEDVARGDWCDRAAAEFVEAHPGFTVDRAREKHLLTSNRGGWIRRNS